MLLQQLINGLMLGSMYSLIAIGYTLVFGLLNLLNLAHGDVFMFGAFIALVFIASQTLPLWAAFIVSMVGAGILGVLIERICFRSVKREEMHTAPVLSTLAFGIVLVDITRHIWGTEPVPLATGIETVNVTFGDLLISMVQIIILVVAVALMLLLDYVIRSTKLGAGLRAIAEQPMVARLLGVHVTRAVLAAFFISSALAGAAGVLWALRIGLADPNVGFSLGLKAVAVMVIGGLGNVRGAMIAGLLVGMVEVLTSAYISAILANLAVWVVLVLILLFRPAGMFGSRLQVEGR